MFKNKPVAVEKSITRYCDFFDQVYWTAGIELKELFLEEADAEEIDVTLLLLYYSENFVTELSDCDLVYWKSCMSMLSFLRNNIFPAAVIRRQAIAAIAEDVRQIVRIVCKKLIPENIYYSFPTFLWDFE